MDARSSPRPPVSVLSLLTSVAPLLIIAVLLYAAFFIKADAVVGSVKPPPLERRDQFLGVAIPSTQVYWAVGSNGKIVRSDDAGLQWAAQKSPVHQNLQSIAAWSSEVAVAGGNDGVMIRTQDAGHRWDAVEVPLSEVANKLLRIHAYPDGTGWAVGEYGALLKTEDQGAHWHRALAEKDQAWNDIAVQASQVWLVGEFGQALRSEDGGITWQSVDTGVESSLMSVSFRDASHGVAVGLSGTVISSDDGGSSWVVLPPQTREHLNDVIWDGHRWVAVGDKGVVVYGDESARSWQASRLAEGNLAWHTQIEQLPANGGSGSADYLLAGAHLARFSQNRLEVFGH